MRQLVTYRTIKEILPIEKADRLEIAMVDGWQVVVGKGEFKVGDLAVYCEVDSILPIRPEFEFLRSSSYKKFEDGTEGFRLRTIKLRGAVSQGLLINMGKLPYLNGTEAPECLQELLNVTKYERPVKGIALAGDVKGPFPDFIRKTDQERIQNLSDYPERYKGYQWEVTEKIDGTSCTVYYKDGDIGVCSRNLELKETENNVYWNMVKESKVINVLLDLKRNLAVQGEICGPGIQGNPLKLEKLEFFIFDIYDIDKHCYLTPVQRLVICHDFMLTHVPVLEFRYTLDSVKEIVDYSKGNSRLGTNEVREGLVWKLAMENCPVVSFKAINNEYLLKHGI